MDRWRNLVDLVAGLLSSIVGETKIEQWVEDTNKELRAAQASSNLDNPVVLSANDTGPTVVEQDAQNAYQVKSDEYAGVANDKLRSKQDAAKEACTEITDVTVDEAKDSTFAALDDLVASAKGAIASAMQKFIHAATAVRKFETKNGAENLPSATSKAQLVAALAFSFSGEAVASGFTFAPVTGLAQGTMLAAGFGLVVVGLGTATGIGIARLQRPSTGERILGSITLIVSVLIAFAMLLLMANTRTVLGTGDIPLADVASEVLSTISFAALADPFLAPLISVNVGGFALVAWKSSAALGWPDLTRLRKAESDAAAELTEEKTGLMDTIDDVFEASVDHARDLSDKARGNYTSAQEQLRASEAIVDEFAASIGFLEKKYGSVVQECRDMLRGTHPAGADLLCLKQAPKPLEIITVKIDPDFENWVKSLEARSLSVDAKIAASLKVYAAKRQEAKDDCRAMFEQIEHEIRHGTFNNIRAVK